LSVAMFAPLNEERHAPSRERCDAVPVEGARVKDEP
jgi:hypothetical protein